MITFGRVLVSELADEEISEKINQNVKILGRNKLQAHITDLWVQILRVFDDVGTKVTVRQMFYQCEVRGAVPKTESGYNQVQSQLVRMRKMGMIPYDWITDNTRWMRKPDTYKSLESFAEYHAKYYRRDLWHNQPDYVEVWIEKEALLGVVQEVTETYDVPLYASKGYSSLTLTYSAAEYIKSITDKGRRAFIYYLGDHDPSGEDIPLKLEKHMREQGAEFTFTRLAVNETQIQEWNLPTRPTKKSDSRAKNFEGDSVELDAIRPDILKTLVKTAIESHLDKRLLENEKRIEQMEKETLMKTFGALKLRASHEF